MKYDLQGTTMQMLNVELSEGETVVSESGQMVYMSDNVKMETKMKGGLWSAIKRKFAGESFFLVNFKSNKGKAMLGFGGKFPGKVVPLRLKAGEQIISQKDAFMCSEESVTFDATFTKKIGAGLLGGEGLILVKVKGPGHVFFNVGGELSMLTLRAGQKIRVDTGNLAMFDAGMDYSVERMRGIKNIIWGGEGLFLATISGPGRVWLQTLPVNELAGKLAEYMPQTRGGHVGRGAAAVAVGGLIGSMMRK